MSKKKLLILDISNLSYRAFAADPTIGTNGLPVGLICGSLKIIQKLCREIEPDEIVCCLDGGSVRKKLNNDSYKAGRSPLKLNRNISVLTPQEEGENKVWQMMRLVEYMNNLPVVQLMYSGVEADDIIAFVSNHPYYSDYNKIIVSNDKDFIQLCDDSIILYRPVKEEFVTRKTVLEEYKIHPNNFALARSLAGDKSDNLDGIGGVGLSTVAKRFPFLSESKSYNTTDLVRYAKEQVLAESKIQAYQSAIEGESKIASNYQMMQLYSPNIPVQDKQKITYTISNFEHTLNKTEILGMARNDGFGTLDMSSLFLIMSKIVLEHKK